MTPLTDRQREVYDFIVWSLDEQGYPPTVRDLMRELEIESPNGVMCHLNALQRKGWITRAPNVSRGIKLTQQAKCPCCGREGK